MAKTVCKHRRSARHHGSQNIAEGVALVQFGQNQMKVVFANPLNVNGALIVANQIFVGPWNDLRRACSA